MNEKQAILKIIKNIVDATSNQPLLRPFESLKNKKPKRFPIVPVAMKKANNAKRPLIKYHVINAKFDNYEVSIR